MKILQLRLDQIKLDSGCQFRVNSDPEYVASLEEAYRNKEDVPRPIVFFDGTDFILADGRNRYEGATAAGLKHLECEVREGTLREAILWAFGPECPNSGPRGLRVTRADKHAKVQRLLADSEWQAWANTAIADACCVSHTFVAGVRKEMEKGKEDCTASDHDSDSAGVTESKPKKRKSLQGGKVVEKQVTQRDDLQKINSLFDRCDKRLNENIAELKTVSDTRSIKANQRALEAIDKAARACTRALEACEHGRKRLCQK
jgi:hypothetical protein